MSDATPIHRHPVAQVQQDSRLSRAAFYKRMAQAGVKPLRVGQNSFLEREHLEALRALEDWIQGGGRPEVFPGRLQTSPDVALVPSAVRDFPSAVVEEPEEDQEAPEELVAAAVSHLDGLLSFLTKAARNSWELPTSQVQLLVGAKPRGTSFSRYGFSFRPSGRHGQETSWRVER
jgi:hypothetical protein